MRLLDILGAKPKEHENDGYSRRANFAGSWYESSQRSLNQSLDQFFTSAEKECTSQEEEQEAVRGLVAPHAGYSYSGATAAFAYRALTQALKQQHSSPTQNITILVLHPSHYFYLNGCAVSGASVIETPLGNLTVNRELQQEILESCSKFTCMKQDVDEHEHSGEMQYPFIAKACNDAGMMDKSMVLPIMVGSLDTKQEYDYGKLLAPIVARSNVITVVSSDFCHWGSRFRFQPFLGETQNVFECIEQMDKTGMTHIALQEPGAFAEYLKQTSNTICGRHPISVWLQAVKHNKDANIETLDIKFVRYAQSSQVKSKSDSSVSYASAVARVASGWETAGGYDYAALLQSKWCKAVAPML